MVPLCFWVTKHESGIIQQNVSRETLFFLAKNLSFFVSKYVKSTEGTCYCKRIVDNDFQDEDYC